MLPDKDIELAETRKRTRTLQKRQSKNGCVTCKARRIKCDESRPGCNRCSASHRQCEGYTINQTSHPTQPDSQAALLDLCNRPACSTLDHKESIGLIRVSDGFPKQLGQERLARLGCEILASGNYRVLGSGTAIWNRLLPQLSNAIPSVNAAAAAFGAMYEANILASPASLGSSQRAAVQYGIAIRHIQQDLPLQLHGPIPLLISCALLASAELLRRRQYNALAHMQGAFRLLRLRNTSLHASVPHRRIDMSGVRSNADYNLSMEDNLTLLFMTLDIQKASYVLEQPPDLPLDHRQPLVHGAFSETESLNEAEMQLIRLVHSCYHFTAKASHYKYLAPAYIPSDVGLEQGRHIAKLTLWLRIFNCSFFPTDLNRSHKLSPDDIIRALVLRTQCHSALIYISTILNAVETSYDTHAERFQGIIQDSAKVLAGGSMVSPELQQFQLCPGIIQPLFLTGIKYRHGWWRRQAIELLRCSGREGPFDGSLLAAVASRAAQVEESKYQPEKGRDIIPANISECDRLHGCGVDAEAKDVEPLQFVTVMFSRCYDTERMLSGPETWEHSSNWDIWDEIVAF